MFYWCFVIIASFQMVASQCFQDTKPLAHDQTAPLQLRSLQSPRSSPYLDQMVDQHFYSPECQRRPCELDEPQRQIPCENLISKKVTGTRSQEPAAFAQSELCCSLELNYAMLVSSGQ